MAKKGFCFSKYNAQEIYMKTIMRILLAAVIGVSLGIGLAGCGEGDGDISGTAWFNSTQTGSSASYPFTIVQTTITFTDTQNAQVHVYAQVRATATSSLQTTSYDYTYTYTYDGSSGTMTPKSGGGAITFTVSGGKLTAKGSDGKSTVYSKQAGGGSTSSTPSTPQTGSVRIVNAYTTGTGNQNTIVSVTIGGRRMSDYVNQVTPIIGRNSSKTYSDIAVGSKSVNVIRLALNASGNALVNSGHSIEDVVVRAGETTTVTISSANAN
jgi:hypothetical protein